MPMSIPPNRHEQESKEKKKKIVRANIIKCIRARVQAPATRRLLRFNATDSILCTLFCRRERWRRTQTATTAHGSDSDANKISLSPRFDTFGLRNLFSLHFCNNKRFNTHAFTTFTNLSLLNEYLICLCVRSLVSLSILLSFYISVCSSPHTHTHTQCGCTMYIHSKFLCRIEWCETTRTTRFFSLFNFSRVEYIPSAVSCSVHSTNLSVWACVRMCRIVACLVVFVRSFFLVHNVSLNAQDAKEAAAAAAAALVIKLYHWISKLVVTIYFWINFNNQTAIHFRVRIDCFKTTHRLNSNRMFVALPSTKSLSLVRIVRPMFKRRNGTIRAMSKGELWPIEHAHHWRALLYYDDRIEWMRCALVRCLSAVWQMGMMCSGAYTSNRFMLWQRDTIGDTRKRE